MKVLSPIYNYTQDRNNRPLTTILYKLPIPPNQPSHKNKISQ